MFKFDGISQYCNNFEDFIGLFQVFYAISRDLLGFSKILGFFQRFFGMDGQEESAAKQKAFENVLPELQKEFADVYVDNLRWMKALKNDPVHRKIMETKETFANEDSFDSDEALSAAVDKRKFLLKQLLEDQGRFSDSDESM